MIDRTTNLLVISVLLAALASLATGLYSAWNSTDPWHKEWVTKTNIEPKHSSQRILDAMRKANAAGAPHDVSRLRDYLNDNFRQTGKVLTRFTSDELWSTVFYGLAPLPLLVFPVFINYLRHGKFRLWNANA